MKLFEMQPTGLLHACDELHRLILENPGLPLVVFAGENANIDGYLYNYMACSTIRAEKGEVLDCTQTINSDRVYCDRDDFKEDLEESLYDEYEHYLGPEDAWEKYIKSQMAIYEPFWKPCIILYVNN